jgi:multisubunit Na+/H+ antiporter MnhC subunit
MASIIAVVATIAGTYTLIAAKNFAEIGLGLLLLGVAIYLLGYSPWL